MPILRDGFVGCNLSSSCHLSQQILHYHIGQHPQQHVAGLRMSVQPTLRFRKSPGASAFYHVGHQRPLKGETSESKNHNTSVFLIQQLNCVGGVSDRSSSESYERHFALYLVSGQRDGFEDVAQLFGHVHFDLQALQVLRLLQGVWERWAFTCHHLDIHTHRLEGGEVKERRNKDKQASI